jgi:hypothetical protein
MTANCLGIACLEKLPIWNSNRTPNTRVQVLKVQVLREVLKIGALAERTASNAPTIRYLYRRV